MPLYEYECQKCGERFELIQKFSDAPLTKHDGCGGKVRKLLSAPAIQFKGTGWYVTDYARSGAKDSDRKSESKSESKADKKEAKTESKTSSDSKTTASESSKTATTETSKK